MNANQNDTPQGIGKPEDRAVQELFSELRQQNEAQAPPFNTVWHEAVRRVHSRETSSARQVGFGFRFAAACVVAVFVFVAAIFLVRQHDDKQSDNLLIAKAESLSLWESPTMVLLSSGEDAAPETAEASSTALDGSSSLSVWEAPSDSLLDSSMGNSTANEELS